MLFMSRVEHFGFQDFVILITKQSDEGDWQSQERK